MRFWAKKRRDMEEKKRLTLNEMYEIFKGDAYNDFRAYYGMKLNNDPAQIWKVPTLNMWCHRDLPLLYRHIIAEQLLIADYHDIPWSDFGAYDRIVFLDLIMLWMNPLSWVNPLEIEEYVVDSRIAQEIFDAPRFDDEILDVFRYIETSRILSFADKPRVCEGDYSSCGTVKGMHYWYDLTMDYSNPMCRIFEDGERLSHEEMHQKITMYHAPSLRNRLMIVAANRGGKRAAELLRMLQAEWPKLKLWKTEMERMTDGQICNFERILYNGFDELLAEWEGEVQEAEVVTEGKRFSLLTDACIAEGKEAKVISELRAACKGTAPALWKVIRTNEALGYLGTRDLEASVIYRAFTEYFGKLPYTERNFRDARSKV